jgi:ATP-binding cassette subfamily F protein uup
LELLEEILLGFDGTVLLVSHDRDFMDHVVTSLMVLDGAGGITEHVGGYSDWEARGGSLTEALALPAEKQITERPARPPALVTEQGTDQPAAKKRKLSYKEQRELESLPLQIEKLEQRVTSLTTAMSEPAFYQSGFAEVQELTQEIAMVQLQLDAAFRRWGELENP